VIETPVCRMAVCLDSEEFDRARCTCILVASPALFDGERQAPRQMKLVNALCRYREMARSA
jgi:hypothetical protein